MLLRLIKIIFGGVLAMNVCATEQTIVLGSGCFWGAEKSYAALPGVIDAVSGYADGEGVEPNYRAITDGANKFNPNNHAEVVQVTFDNSKISEAALLKHFFEHHDPTQLNRQGNDVGTQYRSIILTNSQSQAALATQIKDEYQQMLTENGFGAIQTVIKPLKSFYRAEEYHQDYLVKNPNGYCPDHSTGVKFNPSNQVNTPVDNSELLKGKHVIIIESAAYCPYCEKLNNEVLNDYQGDTPLHRRTNSQVQELSINTTLDVTPIIVFIEDGKEVFAHKGFLEREPFYRYLGEFVLKGTEAFSVAFNQGTDGRFCKQYAIFKDTPDGQFVDTLSGAALFDTKDRFDSGTGWLSFTNAIEGAVYEVRDTSHGMIRQELRSKSSGIHLGHVFDDGPQGQRRYCINATVLDFVAR